MKGGLRSRFPVAGVQMIGWKSQFQVGHCRSVFLGRVALVGERPRPRGRRRGGLQWTGNGFDLLHRKGVMAMGAADIADVLAAGRRPEGLDLPRKRPPTALPALCRHAVALLEVKVPDTLVPTDEPAEPTQAERDVTRLREGLNRLLDDDVAASLARAVAERDRVAAQLASVRSEMAALTASVESRLAAAAKEGEAEGRRAAERDCRDAVERAREQERAALAGRVRAAEEESRTARREAQAAKERIDVLVAELAGLRGAGTELERERAGRAAAERDHAAQVSSLENEVRRLQGRLAEAESRGREPEVDLGPVAGPLDVIRTIPHSLVEEVRLFAGIQDRVEFLPSAEEAAAQYHGGDLDRYWEALIAMHDVMWPLKFQESDVQISRDFRDRTGFQYAANESRETLEIESCRRARTFRYGGRDCLMTNHVKVGNSGNYADGALRIYFLFDEGRQKLVVGHVGKHLPTKSFMRST